MVRRPDVFHAAVSGAAPHDQRLYDTHWRERFLGLPQQNPDGYDRSSTQVLPLSGATHLPTDADTISQLLWHEYAFLAESLGVARPAALGRSRPPTAMS